MVMQSGGGFSQVLGDEDTLEGMKNRDEVTCLFRRGINYKVTNEKKGSIHAGLDMMQGKSPGCKEPHSFILKKPIW